MEPKELEHLAHLIRDKREQAGLSASEVARRAGVTAGTVTRIELGQIPSPRPENLRAIGEVLGISAADLFAATDWLPKNDLPTLTPYLRAKYGDLPETAVDEVEAFVTRLRARHGQHGPVNGEDEQP
jgi:transcriptional regulator with XRE-family HTH domain